MSQYVRVLIIATLSSICVVPVALYMLVNNWITANSWPGLKVIHSDFSPVLVPASVWRSVQVAKYSPEIRRWGFVFNGFVIFACFGIHKEARRRYRLTAYHVFQCVSCFRVKKCFHSLFMCAIQLICYFTALERLQIMTQNLRLRGCCR